MTHFPSWRYGPNGKSAVFESEADVPAGWHDHPSKHEKSPDAAPDAKPKPKPRAPAKTAGKKAGRKPKANPAPLDL